MNGIAFDQRRHSDYIKSRKNFDIAYTIEENNYNGANYTQLLIKDIKTEEAQ